MKKIGIIGEDPNDTSSVQTLLINKYPKKFNCKPLLKNKKGYQLDNSRVPASLKIEFEDYKPDLVIFVRDADGIATETPKIKKVEDWFKKLNPIVKNKGILLTNIYELEALILADIATFNSMYGTKLKYSGDVMYQKEPKEFLINKTKHLKKTYSESHCPSIFEKLNFQNLTGNCKYFKEFIDVFATKI